MQEYLKVYKELATGTVESFILIVPPLITRDMPVYGHDDASCVMLTITKTENDVVRTFVCYVYSSKQLAQQVNIVEVSGFNE